MTDISKRHYRRRLPISETHPETNPQPQPPMSDLRTRIAAVQREHRLVTRMVGRKAEKSCLCGWRSPEWDCTFTDHPEHVADAVIRELNLAIPCATTGCRMRQITRAASDLGATQ